MISGQLLTEATLIFNMGTSATIIAKKGDKYRAIYNNYDGYPDYLLDILSKHYNDDSKVQRLIDLGDVSCVSVEVDIPEGNSHSFDSPDRNITVAYGRDRGESGTSFRVYDTLDDAIYDEQDRYMYLWNGIEWENIAKEL